MMKRVLAVLALFGYFAAAGGLLALVGVFRAEGGEGPAQPIAFSHAIHAGDMALDCTHCHQYVEISRHPGLPSVATCMECHEFAATDRPEIQKLTGYWQEGREVEWIKVYDLPWHVYFSHKRHVKADVDCANCHPDIFNIEKKTTKSFAMKYILDKKFCGVCHLKVAFPLDDCKGCHPAMSRDKK